MIVAEQLTVEHIDRDWQVHDGHGEIVGVFGTRIGAIRFAESFTGDVVVLADGGTRRRAGAPPTA